MSKVFLCGLLFLAGCASESAGSDSSASPEASEIEECRGVGDYDQEKHFDGDVAERIKGFSGASTIVVEHPDRLQTLTTEGEFWIDSCPGDYQPVSDFLRISGTSTIVDYSGKEVCPIDFGDLSNGYTAATAIEEIGGELYIVSQQGTFGMALEDISSLQRERISCVDKSVEQIDPLVLDRPLNFESVTFDEQTFLIEGTTSFPHHEALNSYSSIMSSSGSELLDVEAEDYAFTKDGEILIYSSNKNGVEAKSTLTGEKIWSNPSLRVDEETETHAPYLLHRFSDKIVATNDVHYSDPNSNVSQVVFIDVATGEIEDSFSFLGRVRLLK